MRGFITAWNCFWFKPSTPTGLGFLRVIFFGLTLAIFWDHSVSYWATLPIVFWQPIFVFELLRLPPFPANTLAGMETLWKLALGLSALGIFTRLSLCTSFLLGAYLLGLPHNFGKTHHYDAIIVITMGVLAFSRCGDACSIDRLIRKVREPQTRDAQVAAGEFTWPIRLVWVLMALVFFAAGVSKLRYGGIEWVDSSNFAFTLMLHYYTHELPTTWGLSIAQYDWLCRMLAATTVVLEIGAPTAVFSATLRAVIIPSLFFMQSGIWLLTGVLFLPFLPCYAFWIPWERLMVNITAIAEDAREHFSKAGHRPL